MLKISHSFYLIIFFSGSSSAANTLTRNTLSRKSSLRKSMRFSMSAVQDKQPKVDESKLAIPRVDEPM